MYIEPNINILKSDIERFRQNPNSTFFQQKYNEKNRKGGLKSKDSMLGTIRRTYNQLEQSTNQIDIKRAREIRDSYNKKKTGGGGYSNLWYRMFKTEQPEFINEVVQNKPSNKADVGYYYQINDYLKNFVNNGRFYQFKIISLLRKLTRFFKGVRFYKNTNGDALKVILFIEDTQIRHFGVTFKSERDFNNNWLLWLNSLQTRCKIDDKTGTSGSISYIDIKLLYFKVSTYMRSNIFGLEKNKRFSLKLRYL